MQSKTLTLHYNPLSTYSQKVLIALYERGIAFDSAIVQFSDSASWAAFRELNPLGKIPLLVDGQDQIPESSIIVEYLDAYADGAPLIPSDPALALRARLLDRLADGYVNNTFQTIFFDGRKPEAAREPVRVAAALKALQTVLGRFEQELTGGPWLLGETFSIADCALAPPLVYLQGMGLLKDLPKLEAYLGRVKERPSVARVLEEAAPYVAALMAAT